jgi:hypothetical protein
VPVDGLQEKHWSSDLEPFPVKKEIENVITYNLNV